MNPGLVLFFMVLLFTIRDISKWLKAIKAADTAGVLLGLVEFVVGFAVMLYIYNIDSIAIKNLFTEVFNFFK